MRSFIETVVSAVYTSADHQPLMTHLGMLSSMRRTGVCWDNAMAESFFSALKTECLHRTVCPKKKRARSDFATVFPRLASERDTRGHGVIEPRDRISRTRRVSWECHLSGHIVKQTIQNRDKSAGCRRCDPTNRVGL